MSAYYSQHSCVGPSKEDHHFSAFNPRLAFWWNNQGEWEGRMTLRALTTPHEEKKLSINRCSVRPMWVVKWLEIRRSFSLPLSTLLFFLNYKNEEVWQQGGCHPTRPPRAPLVFTAYLSLPIYALITLDWRERQTGDRLVVVFCLYGNELPLSCNINSIPHLAKMKLRIKVLAPLKVNSLPRLPTL